MFEQGTVYYSDCKKSHLCVNVTGMNNMAVQMSTSIHWFYAHIRSMTFSSM